MKRQAIYFEYEKMTDHLLSFGNNTNMRLVVELGNKSKNKQKIPFFNQYEISSNDKYSNTSRVVTGKRRFVPYIAIDYPSEGKAFNSQIKIMEYSILGLRNKMTKFDNLLSSMFGQDDDGNIIVLADRAKTITCTLDEYYSISFSPGIFESSRIGRDKDFGVSICFNGEFTVTVSALKTWKSFLYLILSADLYGWGSGLINGITSGAIDTTDPYSFDQNTNTYNARNNDESEYVGGGGSNGSKYITNDEKKKRFFDD